MQNTQNKTQKYATSTTTVKTTDITFRVLNQDRVEVTMAGKAGRMTIKQVQAILPKAQFDRVVTNRAHDGPMTVKAYPTVTREILDAVDASGAMTDAVSMNNMLSKGVTLGNFAF